MAKELDELRTQDLVAIGLLLVLHEVLPSSEWRVDVYKADLVAGTKAVGPLLVCQQLAKCQ